MPTAGKASLTLARRRLLGTDVERGGGEFRGCTKVFSHTTLRLLA
jgi:hypothetical protein